MPSRQAQGEPLRRNQHALALWSYSGYVQLDDTKPHLRQFIEEELDRRTHSFKQLAQLMDEHVKDGGFVKEQDAHPEDQFDSALWYAIEIRYGRKVIFIKFVIHPDEAEDPGILIVSIHFSS